MTATGSLHELRSQVLGGCLTLLDSGLVSGTWGMMCARDASGERLVITPSGMDYRTLEPSDLPLVDLAGATVEGTRRPSSETPMMCRLLTLRPDIRAVAHTHSTVATGFASAGREIPVVLAELAEAVGGAVPCAPYVRFGTPELAAAVVDVAGDRRAVLLRNHGVVAFGGTVQEAAATALVVEEAARVALVAQLLGGGEQLAADEVADLRHIHITRYGQREQSTEP